jgi:hypothetical protein
VDIHITLYPSEDDYLLTEKCVVTAFIDCIHIFICEHTQAGWNMINSIAFWRTKEATTNLFHRSLPPSQEGSDIEE